MKNPSPDHHWLNTAAFTAPGHYQLVMLVAGSRTSSLRPYVMNHQCGSSSHTTGSPNSVFTVSGNSFEVQGPHLSALFALLEEMSVDDIASEIALRELYGQPIERARLKSLRKLDGHCASFIRLSPLVRLGTSGEYGADVTPRGDRPGFVQVLDEGTIAIPDWPGNNRLGLAGQHSFQSESGAAFSRAGNGRDASH